MKAAKFALLLPVFVSGNGNDGDACSRETAVVSSGLRQLEHLVMDKEPWTRNRNAHSNLRHRSLQEECPNLTQSEECTLLVLNEDQEFFCEVPTDAELEGPGLLRMIDSTDDQEASLKEMLESGELIPGKDKLKHGKDVCYDENFLFLPHDLQVKDNIVRGTQKSCNNATSGVELEGVTHTAWCEEHYKWISLESTEMMQSWCVVWPNEPATATEFVHQNYNSKKGKRKMNLIGREGYVNATQEHCPELIDERCFDNPFACNCPKAPDDVCDDHLKCSQDVCDPSSPNSDSVGCTHEPEDATKVCRPSVGICDQDDYCDGLTLSCPADLKFGQETVCRASAGVCDVQEVCDGVNDGCPADAKISDGSVCRAKAGDCDVQEVCDGVNDDCPADAKISAGTVCRDKAGDCDQAETCDGLADHCPGDAKLPWRTVCRASAGDCDATERCNGIDDHCPADAKLRAGTVCRAKAGDCDQVEFCDGSSNHCPLDRVMPWGLTCRGSGGSCDQSEYCNGSSTSCPADAKRPAGTVCRHSRGPCDVTERCDGFTNDCPADAKVSAGTLCRSSRGRCDASDYCDGRSDYCWDNRRGGQCRSSYGSCDLADYCTGGIDCYDRKKPSGSWCPYTGNCFYGGHSECNGNGYCRVYCNSSPCFPSGTIVKVWRDDEFVSDHIENLALGDQVKCISQRTKEATTCTVFVHLHPAVEDVVNGTYQEIFYFTGQSVASITLSPNHLMYRLPPDYSPGVRYESIPEFTDSILQFPPAEDIQVGDLIAVEDPESTHSLLAAEVISNEIVYRDGAYAPGVTDGLMLFVDGAVASSNALLPEEDPLAVLLGKNVAHYLYDSVFTYFFSLIDAGVVDTTAFWSRTRDDPVYVAWEAENYRYWLEYMSDHIIPTAVQALEENLSLTVGNAILFNSAVQDLALTTWPLDETDVADLLAKAYRDEL